MSNNEGSAVVSLRAELFAVLKNVSSGKVTAAAANAASNVSGKILQTWKMELDFKKAQGQVPSASLLDKSPSKMLALDSDEEEDVDDDTGEVIIKKKKRK